MQHDRAADAGESASNGAIEVAAPLHRLQLTRLPLPANSTTRMSIVAAKAMRAHTMGRTAQEKKELVMPVGEELPMLTRQS